MNSTKVTTSFYENINWNTDGVFIYTIFQFIYHLLLISKPLNKVSDIVILYFYFIISIYLLFVLGCQNVVRHNGHFFQSDDISIVTVILIHCRHIWFSRGSYQVIMTKTSINALNDKKRMVHQPLNADIYSAHLKWFVLRCTLMTLLIHMINEMIEWL